MIKLIIFDMDGVLVDAKNIHFDALNEALGPRYAISWEDHLSRYDGLKTYQKLEMLTREKGLPPSEYTKIWNEKQRLTEEKIRTIPVSTELKSCIEKLAADGYRLACCSNSIRHTILTVLRCLDISDSFDYIVSNEDVKNGKPHPEMYWKTMIEYCVLPEETIIVEDSPYGLLAASRSKSNVLRVKNPSEVTYNNITSFIKQMNTTKGVIPKWNDSKLNVLIPMAGAGSRFEKAGYTFPKPLIDVRGKPMIQVVVENLNISATFIYVVRTEHRIKYNLDTLLKLITPNCKIVEVDHLTEGAACTALLAREHIDNDAPLFFANSDQFAHWDSNEFFYKMNECDADGGIVTFTSYHPKWSFVKVNPSGFITEVAEKNPISDRATTGFYYWKRGSDFVKYADQMISMGSQSKINNEWYLAPTYNLAINDGKKIREYKISEFFGLGTPEDLNFFLSNTNE